MSYVSKILVGDEQIIYSSKLSLWSQLLVILLCITFGIVALVGDQNKPEVDTGMFGWVAAFLMLIIIIKQLTTEIGVTNRRLICKAGLISRKMIELKIEKIESFSVNQGMLGRLFNYGSLIVTGSGGTRVKINGIKNPFDLSKAVNELI